MSKSAIHAMTMSLATEWGRYGIRLNTIAPGEIPTEGMSKRIKPGDEAGARTIAINPMGRVGKMEELQNLAVFLISGGCDWINGETIAMDGGQALAMGGNFYQLRDWSDADWTQARESIKAQNEKDRAATGVKARSHPKPYCLCCRMPPNSASKQHSGRKHVRCRGTGQPCRHGARAGERHAAMPPPSSSKAARPVSPNSTPRPIASPTG